MLSVMDVPFLLVQAKDLNLAAASAKDIGFKCPLTSQAEKM